MKQKGTERTQHNGHGNSEIQQYGTVVNRPISLDSKVRQTNCEKLNQILADTITLRDMYKKHHWQVAGPTFYQLHLLFDKHFAEQAELVDTLAERVQTLGGVAIAMAHDVAETTTIARPPRGRETVNVQLFRLLEAHEQIIAETREAADAADEDGDLGTNDILVSEVLRTNEFQVWFITEQLANTGIEEKGGAEAAMPELAGSRRGGH
ncbi:MAG: DNA starvation/stationary phase protection protein [Acidobacteriia bacterium]|nr:DNA starvation/stationary phase protection protein [Terriglobia bacterium]